MWTDAPGPAQVGEAELELNAFSRADWAQLGIDLPLVMSQRDLSALGGVGEPISVAELKEIYLPLGKLIELHVAQFLDLARARAEFTRRAAASHPFIIAIAGSVAAGKSTIARLLQQLLSRLPGRPRVQIVTTDGFLYPKKILEDRGLMSRKGFPESYDLARMFQFLTDVRLRGRGVSPVYSHQLYDIVPDELLEVSDLDILIFEGLNVLQIGAGNLHRWTSLTTASDFFDFSIYVDADENDLARWYIERFLFLRRSTFKDPASYFHRLVEAGADEVRRFALDLWNRTNLPNLRENIRPFRSRADVILHKGSDHSVQKVWLR